MEVSGGTRSISHPDLGLGLGLRVPHFPYILRRLPKVGWFEAISENFMRTNGGDGGRHMATLDEIRSHYPVVLHGVSMSLGSTDPLDLDYLKNLKTLYARVEPAWVSDHLCWTGVEGVNLHDLLPLPYTEEALRHVVARVERVQEFLGRRILLENVSSYLTYAHSHMTEWDFIAEVARRADCGILLDVNNIYVSSRNHGFDPLEYLNAIPPDRVGQFHIAGHLDNGDHVVDTHDHPVCDAVWDLYWEARRRFPRVSTLLERDEHIPDFPVLLAELKKAKRKEPRVAHAARSAKADAVVDHRP